VIGLFTMTMLLLTLLCLCRYLRTELHDYSPSLPHTPKIKPYVTFSVTPISDKMLVPWERNLMMPLHSKQVTDYTSRAQNKGIPQILPKVAKS